MDYSVGIIYHYFKSKDQIIFCVLQESYKEILTAVRPQNDNLPADEKIRASLIRYIESALERQSEYKSVMLSSMPQILDFTSVLGEGICEKRPALMMLVSELEAGISGGLFAPCDAQLTAQSIWSAAFGLAVRLMIECDVPEVQRKKLIERQVDLIMKGLRK
jgi:AcrR family transcriptional regulator